MISRPQRRWGWLLASLALIGASSTSAATISLWHAMNGKAGDAVQAQCRRFNAAQTLHSLRCSYQGDYARLMQKTIAAFRAGRQPTLVQFFDVALRDLLESGAVQPVSTLYERDGESAWQDDLLAPVRDWYADERGQLLGQPFNVSTALLYVNDTQLRAAGIATAPTTWDQLREAGRALKKRGARCAFVTDLDAWTTLEQYAATEGIAIATPRNGHAAAGAVRYALDNAALRGHLQWLLDGQREGWLRIDSQTRAGDVGAAFRSGECAMLLAATGVWSGISATIGARDQVSANPLPIEAGTTRRRTSIGGAALYLMQDADAPQQAAAAAFLRFARRPDEQRRFADDTGFLPYTDAAVRQRRARGVEPEQRLDAVEVGLESLAHPAAATAPSLRLGFYAQFRAAWKEELQRAMVGQQDAEQTLAHLQRRGDELLQRFALTYVAAASRR